MEKISELTRILKDNFDWNKARLDCFVRMLLALFAVRTVNLSEMAVGFASEAEKDSRYKRIHRFFSQFIFDYPAIAQWIFKLFVGNQKIYLTVDRTNWYWGKTKINIFMLGIAYEGISIPLLWNMLDKAGNASAHEHIALVKRFIDIFDVSQIEGVLGDREFASGTFFKWLSKHKIPFYIRIKEDSLARISKKRICKAKKIFNDLKLKQKKHFDMAVEVFGQKLYLAGSRSERGELMIVVTNRKPVNAIAIYLRRWEIETLFSCLKGRGFRFEETHLTQLDRIEKLTALLAVGFCWAHKTGEWRAEIKPIRFGKHRDSIRPQNSYFRYGFDFIREIILSPFRKMRDFKCCLNTILLNNVQEGANL